MYISKWRRTLISLIATALVFGGLVWFSETKIEGKIVQIKEVNQRQVVMEDQSGRIETLNIPELLDEPILKDQTYFIEYKKKRWTKPVITKIESRL